MTLRKLDHEYAMTLSQVQGEAHVPSVASGEYEIEMPPPLALSDLPPALAHTLQHIVSKLDMMTQVIGMVEERLSLNEDKMANMEAAITALSNRSKKPASMTSELSDQAPSPQQQVTSQ
jgi:hypothetical protein